MERISSILLNSNRLEKQNAREKVGSCYDPLKRLEAFPGALTLLACTRLSTIDRAIKHGKDISFEEAFCGMCYVLAATNRRFYAAVKDAIETAYNSTFTSEKALACGTAFVQLMAAKEAMRHLTPEEVAGIAAASLMDTVIQLDRPHVIETCGMGGDVGFVHNGTTKKTINVSTLSAILLAALKYPVAKHGSYANTSAVGSTEAIELLGANTSLTSIDEVERVWEQSGFCFLDAHWCKTIHDLSHLLMMETINHVAGPMSPPFTPTTRITKLMGVNEKVHPSVIARAYAILHERNLQLNSGIAIVCGLDAKGVDVDPYNVEDVRSHTVVDELSPYASVVSLAYEDNFLGSFLVTPEDFGVTINPEAVQVLNTQEAILEANTNALKGKDDDLANYLAMNAALALFIEKYHDHADLIQHRALNRAYLRECFSACRGVIDNKMAEVALGQHILSSKSL